VSNLGAKISYTDATRRDFLPMNLRLGPRVTWELNESNRLSASFDLNKYLVPSPPRYLQVPKSEGDAFVEDENGNLVTSSGMDPDRPVPTAIFTSFYDAPGYGTRADDGTWQPYGGGRFREELNEVAIGVGLEYWYAEQFAFRMGYFNEHYSKGNRKFVTLGAGLKLNVFGLDFSYLISTYNVRTNNGAQSPLANTLRFTLSFDFAEMAAKDEGS
jgi:hypothetical protein